MAFADRNKRWLLPAVGVILAGVVWLNLPARSVLATLPPSSAHQVPVLVEGPPGVPAADPGRPDRAGLRALASPPPRDNDVLPLLQAGRQALAPELLRDPAAPVLHRDLWPGLFRPVLPRPSGPGAPPVPPPVLDFLFENGLRQEAWVDGKAYRQGERLPGGFLLKRITATGVVLAGPLGDVVLALAAPPRPQHHPRSGPEAPHDAS